MRVSHGCELARGKAVGKRATARGGGGGRLGGVGGGEGGHGEGRFGEDGHFGYLEDYVGRVSQGWRGGPIYGWIRNQVTNVKKEIGRVLFSGEELEFDSVTGMRNMRICGKMGCHLRSTLETFLRPTSEGPMSCAFSPAPPLFQVPSPMTHMAAQQIAPAILFLPVIVPLNSHRLLI